MLGLGAQLRYRLCNQDVEPVERFGLVVRDVVEGFGEDGGRAEGCGYRAERGEGGFGAE